MFSTINIRRIVLHRIGISIDYKPVYDDKNHLSQTLAFRNPY